MTDSLIIYRNPVEEQIWATVANGDITIVFSLLLWAIGTVIVYALVEKLLGHMRWNSLPRRFIEKIGRGWTMALCIIPGWFIAKIVKVSFFIFLDLLILGTSNL